MKKVLILGSTGQDGSYLTALLVKKNLQVSIVRRAASTDNLQNIKRVGILEGIDNILEKINIEHSDVTDALSIRNLVEKIKPDYIYNLAAQSHVGISFETPLYTANVDAIGALNILEAIHKVKPDCKFYQASTSELYGGQYGKPLNEETKFNPRSPYAAAKMYAFNITKIYREAYGIFACNGILFNHESPLRGEHFVTQKIVKGLVNKYYKEKKYILKLGNLDASRDWGHARDYVMAMSKILEATIAEDFVIGSGKTHTVREFCELVCNKLGVTNSFWIGQGLNEKLIWPDYEVNEAIVVDSKYYRPLEVDHLLADPTKANKLLNWASETSIENLVTEMVNDAIKYV
jgi:GDPmannose 4,6-dehydratase